MLQRYRWKAKLEGKLTPPDELPIEEPRQMRLTVNLRTAKELGVQIPESILLQAQEVVR
jgi:putative ABC transport system substrate-binding protein